MDTNHKNIEEAYKMFMMNRMLPTTVEWMLSNRNRSDDLKNMHKHINKGEIVRGNTT